MAANERLRTTMLDRGETPESVATQLKVDPKTVERWIGGRVPYTRTRHSLAKLLQADETYLWPGSKSAHQLAGLSESEILTVYPHRWAVPRDAWSRLFDEAEEEIGILVFGGYNISDDPGLRQMLKSKAEEGLRVRILLGDPDGPEVAARGRDEGIDESLAAKVRNSIVNFRRLGDGVEIRLHRTTLYNSIYRGDDELLVNSHIYGMAATDAPVMHLKQIVGGSMVTTYLESFERVWDGARPLDDGD